MRRELSFYFDTVLNFSGSVTEHNFLLRCIPADAPEQSILSYTLTVYPDGAASLGRDSFGNVVRAGRVVEAHDSFRYTLQGMAYRDDSLRVTPDPGYAGTGSVLWKRCERRGRWCGTGPVTERQAGTGRVGRLQHNECVRENPNSLRKGE